MLLHFVYLVLCLTVSYRPAEGHGRLMDPPGRSTLWRFVDSNPLITPYESIIEANYNDNQLFCGGAQYQAALGGACGVCGDPADAEVQENIPPDGKYAKGIIVRQYAEGDWISVKVELTTHHLGYFEFRLCEWNDVTTPVTHDCLNQNLLKVTNMYTTQYDITNNNPATGMFHINVKLPDDVTCDQCVLQWRYHTGNTWGCVGSDCGLGKGPQEEFYGCADIAIGTNSVVPPPGFEEGDNVVSTSTFQSSTSQSSTSSSGNTPTTTTTTTTSASTTTTTTTPGNAAGSTSTSSSESGVCDGNENGYVKIDCYSYYRCDHGVPHKFQCPAGTMVDEATFTCYYESQVNCT